MAAQILVADQPAFLVLRGRQGFYDVMRSSGSVDSLDHFQSHTATPGGTRLPDGTDTHLEGMHAATIPTTGKAVPL